MTIRRGVVAGLAATGLVAGILTGTTEAQADSTLAPLLGPSVSAASSSVVKDSYIVVLKDDTTLGAAGVATGSASSIVSAAAARTQRIGGRVSAQFSHAMHGYSATLTSAQLTAVRQDPAVKYVQRNRTVSMTGVQNKPYSWGLDRIDQKSLPLDGRYTYTTTHYYVAYVVDTGIQQSNPNFTSRVYQGTQTIGGTGTGIKDCNGHGTAVAGVIGSLYNGVAKTAGLVPVKVLDCNGNGTDSSVIGGLDWIKAQQNDIPFPGVINMSLSGGPGIDQAMNDSVQGLIDSGLTVVVAAGNAEEDIPSDACTESPSSVQDAIVVAASDKQDRAASWSNYGPCVDIYAPGVGIESDWITKTDGYYDDVIVDGTSFAAPYVTGTAVLYKGRHKDATPAQVWSAIDSWSTRGRITRVPAGTPNKLLLSLEKFSAPASTTGTDRLRSGSSIARDGTSVLTSKGGKYHLTYRASDGRLCLYTAAGKAHWCNGKSSAWTTMTSSGVLSSYDTYFRPTWTANSKLGPSTLIVNDKGYIYIKRNYDGKVTWSSPH